FCKTLSIRDYGNGPYRGNWLSEVDGGLTSIGIEAISFTRSEGLRLPSNQPHLEEGGYGEWDHHDCIAALDQLAATASARLQELDSDTRGWVEFGLDVAAKAASRPDFGVAGFFNT